MRRWMAVLAISSGGLGSAGSALAAIGMALALLVATSAEAQMMYRDIQAFGGVEVGEGESYAGSFDIMSPGGGSITISPGYADAGTAYDDIGGFVPGTPVHSAEVTFWLHRGNDTAELELVLETDSQQGCYDLETEFAIVESELNLLVRSDIMEDGNLEWTLTALVGSFHLDYGMLEVNSEICSDNIDNDGDGDIDAADSDCDIAPVLEFVDYVAMGDSYSSGEGAGYGNYVAGTAFNGINSCHRAPSAYGPNLNLAPDFVLQPDEFLACSGALIENISIGGPAAANDGPGATSQLDATFSSMPDLTVVNEDTDFITITIGGNDIQFDIIVQNCVAGSSCHASGAFWIDDDGRSIQEIADENGLQTLDEPIETLLNEIRSRAPQASILLLGYPAAVAAAAGPKCEGFDFDERIAARAIVSQLNGRLQIAAANAGVHFVDVTTYFEDNELCVTTEPYFTGFEGGATGAILEFLRINFADEVIQQGFHPNSDGHDAYRRAVEDCLQTLIVGGCVQNSAGYPLKPCPPGVSCTGVPFLAAAQESGLVGAYSSALPKGYSALAVEAVPAPPCDTGQRFTPGEMVRITGGGFEASSSVEIRIGSFGETFTEIIGTTFADSSGELDYTFAIPALFPTDEAGGIGAIGVTPEGGDLALSTLIGVVTSTVSDGDSDSIPDVCDLCPGHADPLQIDVDGDGIGDACDTCINDPANDADADGLCADVDPCPLDATNADPDLDGLCNAQDSDDDGDGLSDLWETNTGVFVNGANTGTDPNLADSDGDGFDDWMEIVAGYDPNDPGSQPGISVPTLTPLGWGLAVLVLVLTVGGRLGRRHAL